MEDNKLAVVNTEKNLASELKDVKSQAYTSLGNESREEKSLLYKAMSNPDERLSDHINQTIMVKDVYMEMVDMVNEETGEVVTSPRIVLIDENNVSFQCVSFGVFNALKRIFQVFGEPTWNEPIKMKVIQVQKKEKKMLSLDVEI